MIGVSASASRASHVRRLIALGILRQAKGRQNNDDNDDFSRLTFDVVINVAALTEERVKQALRSPPYSPQIGRCRPGQAEGVMGLVARSNQGPRSPSSVLYI